MYRYDSRYAAHIYLPEQAGSWMTWFSSTNTMLFNPEIRSVSLIYLCPIPVNKWFCPRVSSSRDNEAETKG